MEKYTFKEKIYDYINSKAISEYCRKIKHEFSVVECVAIIRQSHCTLEEKFAAFNEIIETMPDEKIEIDIDDPQSGERRKESIGIHEFLKIYMKSKKILIQEFKESDENYIYERYYDDGSEAGRYKDFQSCVNAEVDDSLIRMKKRELYNDKGIYVTMNKNKEILHIWRSYYDYTKHTVKEIEVYFKYQTLAFPVPSPFKCGDIVYMKRGEDEKRYPFVLDKFDYEMDYFKKCSDDQCDMVVYGYFCEEDGTLYHDGVSDYLDMEYYDGELENEKRVLRILSDYIKGEKKIYIEQLLNMSHMILEDSRTAKNRKKLDDMMNRIYA